MKNALTFCRSEKVTVSKSFIVVYLIYKIISKLPHKLINKVVDLSNEDYFKLNGLTHFYMYLFI